MKLREMTLGASTSRKWNPFSALIKWWWGTEYSHIYIKWSTPWGFDEVLEASGFSVKMVEANTWAKKQRIVEEVKFLVTKEEFHKVMIRLRSKTGKKYGWSQAYGIAVAELLGRKDNHLADGEDSFICSEIGAEFLEILQVPIKVSKDRASPKDIMDAIQGRG